MMDLQIQAIKKKTLSNKLNFYARQEKEQYLKKHPQLASKKKSSHAPPSKFSSLNFFALFKDTPEKLLDFPFSSSFSQISAQETTTHHYVLSTVPVSLNTMIRRKKLQHHEETVPLFSRI